MRFPFPLTPLCPVEADRERARAAHDALDHDDAAVLTTLVEELSVADLDESPSEIIDWYAQRCSALSPQVRPRADALVFGYWSRAAAVDAPELVNDPDQTPQEVFASYLDAALPAPDREENA